jgi:hypothetical protein
MAAVLPELRTGNETLKTTKRLNPAACIDSTPSSNNIAKWERLLKGKDCIPK